MTQIKDTLVDYNPWWKGQFTFEYKERAIYTQLQKYTSLKHIIALTGLRRVGKTTLMFKMIKDLLDTGVSAQHILYFSFDNFTSLPLHDLLREYESLISTLSGQKIFLFLDEIQKVENWENQLKALYDIRGAKLKIMISGSESLFIHRKSKEFLAGRLFSFVVHQLSFKEFLTFKAITFNPVGIYSRELAQLLEDFIRTQGFPELVNIKDKEIIKKYVQEGIVEKILYKDLPALLAIQDPAVLESLLSLFSEDPGQLLDLNSIAQQLQISRQTLSQYINYLEDAFLLRKLYNYSRNQKKIERKLRKVYPTILSVDLTLKEDDYSRSRVFEWLVVNQVRPDFFWRDQYKNEVDMVLDEVPVEIKYGKTDTSGILSFMRKFGVTSGVIITRGEQKQTDKRIKCIPAHEFLLEQKPTEK